MGCVLHLDRFLFQPIWNQMYNCQFVWPFCLEYQNITCMDRLLSRCASVDFYLERESSALSGFRKRPKLCWTFAKASTQLSHATSYRHLKLLTKFQKVFLLTKVCYWQRQRQRQSFLLTKTKFFIDKSLLLIKTLGETPIARLGYSLVLRQIVLWATAKREQMKWPKHALPFVLLVTPGKIHFAQ